MMKTILAAMIAVLCSSTLAHAAGGDFEQWLALQQKASLKKMLDNVSPAGTSPGVVVASPSKFSPNYYYHWVRDAALTMDTVVSLYSVSQGQQRQALQDRILAFARFSRRNQDTQTKGGIGEPKFNTDGSAFMDNWCRPQNDGPALRATTLIHFVNQLLERGGASAANNAIVSELYSSNSESVIKTDLEFVSHHWTDKGCDIWEEVVGDHFYTKLVQRRALLEGANLANRLGDAGAATWYASQAQALEPSILSFWSPAKNIFVPTVGWSGGIWYKDSQLDAQVILGILHSGAFTFNDPRVVSTMNALRDRFKSDYAINNRQGSPGVGIGRYPEDKFDGANFVHGNPWFLITSAFANASYRAAIELSQTGQAAQASAMIAAGDEYLKRVQFHAANDGSISEQFDRDNGYMTSAPDLTWSHLELVQATWARAQAVHAVTTGENYSAKMPSRLLIAPSYSPLAL